MKQYVLGIKDVNGELAADMTREDAIKIIEEFGKAGGNIFIDGCKGTMSYKDLITLAESCQILMQKNAKGKAESNV